MAGAPMLQVQLSPTGESPVTGYVVKMAPFCLIPPTATDDRNQGFSYFSLWNIPSSGRMWICADNTPGAAVWIEIKSVGTTGTQGPAGPGLFIEAEPGEEGPPGAPGGVGPAGNPGATGPAGSAGPQGPAGVATFMEADEGPQGEMGPPGGVGPQGNPGSTGSPGPSGPQGPMGPAVFLEADEGPQGDYGPPGGMGPQGPQGASGPSGAQGPSGPALFMEAEPGEEGTSGPPGMPGQPGATGSIGPQGPAGPAMFLAAEPGDDGPIGPPGGVGPQGPAGSAGVQGPTGPALFIAAEPGEDGMMGPPGGVGPSGASGSIGPQGPPGPGGQYFLADSSENEPLMTAPGRGVPTLGSLIFVGGSADVTGTVVIPSWATYVRIDGVSAGGGGGSGRRGASGSLRNGGNGGNGGSISPGVVYSLADLATFTLFYSLGKYGAGGLAVSATSTDGNAGGDANPTFVCKDNSSGAHIYDLSKQIGTKGGAGGNAATTGTAAVANLLTDGMFLGGTGGVAAATASQVQPTLTWFAPGGGEFGLSTNASNVDQATSAAAIPGMRLATGGSAVPNNPYGGQGGAGATVHGAAGGAGANYGAGGGGGAYGTNTVDNSGAGGNGGPAIIRFQYW